jgi:hypothetical protein
MESQRITEEKIALLQFYKQEHDIAHQGMAAFTVMLGQTIQTNLSGALVDVIMRTKTVKQAFADLGKAMIAAIADFMVQKLVAFALEKTLLGGTAVAQNAYVASVLPGMTALALAVNIATEGAAGAAAAVTSGVASASLIAAMGAAAAASKAIGSSGLANGMSGGGSNGVSYGGGWAKGGEGVVSRPTLFLAGEAGPERFQFTPVGKESGESKTVNFHVEINVDSPVVSKESDLDYLTEAISRRVFQEYERIR